MTAPSPVAARALSRRFGDFLAVDDVDLEVAAGEIVGLVGANGAGKTTVIRMVLGLLGPTSGTIRLFGRRHDRELRRRIGYVPQNLGLYTDLTTAENLQFRADVYGGARIATDGPAAEGLVADLPLGIQRQVAFQSATQHEPELLVLDEPTSGVSPLARSRLWDLIHANAERGVAVLVSTHYMDEAEQADQLVIMSQGRAVATGTSHEIIGRRTVTEVAAARWADAFTTLDRGGRAIRLAGRRIRVLGEAPEHVRAELDAAGIAADLAVSPASLEEVLIELDRTHFDGRARRRRRRHSWIAR